MQKTGSPDSNVSRLKLTRRIVSMLFFVLTCLSVWFIIPDHVADKIMSFQLGPLVIRLTAGSNTISIISISIMLFVFVGLGRVYCSTICPLGFVQDLTIWIGKISGIKTIWEIKRKKQLKILRISLLAIAVILLIFGNAFFAGVFEPFAFFSRFLFSLKMISLWPIIGSLSIVLSIILSSFFILLLAAKRGRFFCSWLCPVGTMLWGLSGISLFKVRIRQTKCNQCNKCLKECKAGAISVSEKRIDQALCIGCFNCLPVCKPNAIKITPEILNIESEVNLPEKKDVLLTERREFIKHLGAMMFVICTSGKVFAGSRLTDILPENDQLHFVFPLGSTDLTRFKSKCTGCMICASKCPTKIIGPSMGSFSSSPVLPALSFQNNYCLEDCVACSQVCPTGALQEVVPENKKITKMASLELKLADCRIVDEGLECAICAEICPLQAIEMKQVPGQLLPVPVVLQDKCNGCGKCQYRCPVKKREDIFKFTGS